MKHKILTTVAAATLTLGLGATAAGQGRPPARAKAASPRVWPVSRPVSARCNRLVSCRLLLVGIEVKDVGVLAFPTVLSLHRTDPELFQTGGVTVIVGGTEVPATWCGV